MQHLISQSTFCSSESLVNVTQLLAKLAHNLSFDHLSKWMGHHCLIDGYEKITFILVSQIVKVRQLLLLFQVLSYI